MAALAKIILSPALRGTHLHAVKHVRRVRYTPYPNATVVVKSLTIQYSHQHTSHTSHTPHTHTPTHTHRIHDGCHCLHCLELPSSLRALRSVCMTFLMEPDSQWVGLGCVGYQRTSSLVYSREGSRISPVSATMPGKICIYLNSSFIWWTFLYCRASSEN